MEIIQSWITDKWPIAELQAAMWRPKVGDVVAWLPDVSDGESEADEKEEVSLSAVLDDAQNLMYQYGKVTHRYPSPRHRSARHRPSRSAPPRWARSACGGKARGRGGGRRAKFQGHRTPRTVVPSKSRLLAGDTESGKRAGPLQGLELLVAAPGRIKAPKPCR